MKYYAGLDVSLEESHLCIVDEDGRIEQEAVIASEPAALVGFLDGLKFRLERLGLAAGPLSQWLYKGLFSAGVPVVCLETRHLKAMLSSMTVKTDRKDARGIAQAVRCGWYRAVHVKSEEAQEIRVLLQARVLMNKQMREVSSSIRGLLRNFGLKVGKVGKAKFAARVRELLASRPSLKPMIEPLLAAREALQARHEELHKQALQAARQDPVCELLMSASGVGAIVALSYRSGVDNPHRFSKSKAVGAHFGITPRRYKSGQVDRVGRISKVGDEMVRTALYQAANTILSRETKWSSLKAWAMRVAKRRGHDKAKVALARKLAVVLHRMWIDATEFRFSRSQAPAQAA